MDSELIGGIAISVGLFSLVTWIVLRFTPSPGLRLWSFIVVLLLSYPAFFVIGGIGQYFRLPLPPGHGPIPWRVIMGAMVIGAPLAAWATVCVAVAIRHRPRRLIWIVSPIAGIFLVLGWARYSVVPWRMLDYQVWSASHPTWGAGVADDPDANRLPLFVRANLDYLVSPEARFERLTFYDFWRENPETVYMRFLEDYGRSAIIYCYSTREKKFLWKAWWPIHES